MNRFPIFLLIIVAFSLSTLGAQDYPIETVVQTGHYAEVTSVAYSSDGHFAATGSSDKTVKLWEVPTSKEIYDFFVPNDRILSVVFLPDGNSLIAGTERNHAIQFSLADASEIRRYSPDTANINMQKNFGYPTAHSVDISPDGKTLLSGSSDRTAFLFDLRTGR
jgi:WD40 repeat protein